MPARQVPDPEVQDQNTVASQADDPARQALPSVVAMPLVESPVGADEFGDTVQLSNPFRRANGEVKTDSTDKSDFQSADDFGLNGASDTGTIAAPRRRLGPPNLPNGHAGGCDRAGL